MRLSAGIALLLCAGAAQGATPVRVVSVEGACFGADALEAAIAAHVAGKPAAATEVAVHGDGAALVVEVTRDGLTERRVVPAGGCAGQLEAAALIASRAALPIAWRGAAPRPEARAEVHIKERAESGERRRARREAPPPVEKAPEEQAVAESTPPPEAPPSPPPPPAPPPVIAPAPAPGSSTEIVVAAPARRPPHVEIAAEARMGVGLDDGLLRAGGLAWIGGRIGRLRLLAAGGVEQDVDESRSSGLKVEARRFPVEAGVGWDFGAPRGAVRLAGGALVEVWSAEATGVAHASSATVVHGGAWARGAYRLQLGRNAALYAAVELEVVPVRESFAVGGVGTVIDTPRFWLWPSVGAEAAFF